MVHSYKGGSGKTLFSANLAHILSEQFSKKVLLIEGDLEGPVYHRIFEEAKPDIFINQYLKDLSRPIGDYIYTLEHDFDIIFASPKFSMQDLIQKAEYEMILDNILEIKSQLQALEYDVIILDLGPGINYFAISSLILTDEIFLLIRADQNAVEGTKLLLDQVYTNTIRKETKRFHAIFNQVPDYLGFDKILDEWKIIFKHQYSFVESSFEIPYSAETNYNFVAKQILLPDSDPTYRKMKDIIEAVIA